MSQPNPDNSTPGSIGLLIWGQPLWVYPLVLNSVTHTHLISGSAKIVDVINPPFHRNFNLVGKAMITRKPI
jgi:hypothetical protein